MVAAAKVKIVYLEDNKNMKYHVYTLRFKMI